MTYQEALKQWQKEAQAIRSRANRLDKSMHDRAWSLAATVGIPRCACSLHNAAIDDSMTGWCAGNPERLKVAKQANHMLNQWKAARIAGKLINESWNRLMVPHGYCEANR